MTDYSRDRLGPNDEDRLPWLEPVEEEYDDGGGGGPGRLIIWIVAAVAVVALIGGAYLWMRSSDQSTSGDGALIEAPDSYYKERADENAAVMGEDEIVYSASKGNEVESVIDTSSVAETPVNIDRPAPAEPAPVVPAPAVSRTTPVAPKPTAPPAAAKPAAAEPAVKAPAKAKPVAAPPAPVPSSGGSTIQLGAFSSQAKANAAWKTLSGRFSFLSGLTQSVVPVQSGDKTLYRLRASGGNVGDICGRLRTAGETCSVVG